MKALSDKNLSDSMTADKPLAAFSYLGIVKSQEKILVALLSCIEVGVHEIRAHCFSIVVETLCFQHSVKFLHNRLFKTLASKSTSFMFKLLIPIAILTIHFASSNPFVGS